MVWSTATPLHFYMIYDCFWAVMAELSSCGRDSKACKASSIHSKNCLFNTKNFPALILDHVLRPWGPGIPRLHSPEPASRPLMVNPPKTAKAGLFAKGRRVSSEMHGLWCGPERMCVCVRRGAVASPRCHIVEWDSEGFKNFKFEAALYFMMKVHLSNEEGQMLITFNRLSAQFGVFTLFSHLWAFLCALAQAHKCLLRVRVHERGFQKGTCVRREMVACLNPPFIWP